MAELKEYIVVNSFRDSQDSRHSAEKNRYVPGDIYEGARDRERIAALADFKHPKTGERYPLIAEKINTTPPLEGGPLGADEKETRPAVKTATKGGAKNAESKQK